MAPVRSGPGFFRIYHPYNGFTMHLPSLPCLTRRRGFTLLEVLVALVIVGTALGACLRAVGSLVGNNEAMRETTLATWSAENRFAHIRIDAEWPAIGTNIFDCSQGDTHLICTEQVSALPNPNFRRVEVSVGNARGATRRIVKLIQVVSHAP
jgi:general secretion pathway protein I